MLQLVYDYRAVMSPCHTCKTMATPHYPLCAENACIKINNYLDYLGEKPHTVSPFQDTALFKPSGASIPKEESCTNDEYLQSCEHIITLVTQTKITQQKLGNMIGMSATTIAIMLRRGHTQQGRPKQVYTSRANYKKIMDLTFESVTQYAKDNKGVYHRCDYVEPEKAANARQKLKTLKAQGLSNIQIGKIFGINSKSVWVFVNDKVERMSLRIWRKVMEVEI